MSEIKEVPNFGSASSNDNDRSQIRAYTQRNNTITDLDESIRVVRKVVDATPKDHPDCAGRLNSLGTRLGDRYSRTRAIADLEEAIRVVRQAFDATPKEHPDHPACLNNLGAYLRHRYSRTGTIADLVEAIELARQAVDATPKDHPDRAARLNNLGAYIRNRYSRTEEIADLEEAIRVARQAVSATPKDHPDRALFLNNLGTSLSDRYSRMEAIADLSEAIRVVQQAVNATPKDHPDRAARLNNLGTSFGDRYLKTGSIADLAEAIELARQAVDATPKDHPDCAARLNNLGAYLRHRYSRTGTIADLTEAIELARQAVDATPKDHPDHPACLNNLGAYLGDRYSKTGSMADLEEAIQVVRQAVEATPKDHPDRAAWLNNLGTYLRHRYSRTEEIADLEEAIRVTRQAVSATPKDHPDRALFLNNLGTSLSDRYSRTESMADLKESITHYESALILDEAPIDIRMTAGILHLRSCALLSDWERGSKYSTMSVEIAPRLTSRSLETLDKQHRLSQIVGLACDASAAAFNAGKIPLIALNLLEQGRGVLGASLDDMWTDILDLRTRHPNLAERFISLRDELQPPIEERVSPLTRSHMPFPKTQGDQRHFAGSELDRLIVEIQQQSGFEDFLRPSGESEILDAGKYGPIIVINVSKYRCDAILIERHQIRSVPLPNLTHKGVAEKVQQGSLESPEVLKWLWDVIGLPVLDALAFTEPPPDDKWPYVWWIPTGPLSKFPLHAAGYHGTNCSVLDRVMSSYSSSVKAIIHRRRHRNHQDAPKGRNKALLVALQDTPNQDRLPFAAREVKLLSDLCKSSNLDPVQTKQHKKDVVAQLPSCTIFHFAGHGHTDNKDPSKSALLLEDWESDPFTVSNLLEMNLREHGLFLAYLSACGTGEIRDERFFDESIHLISACQLAGFRHVIGTLWEVNDESCMDMAKTTYDEIIHGGMTDESVCLGLHKATRNLRNRWLQTSKVKRNRKLVKNATPDKVKQKQAASRNAYDSRLPRKVNPCDSDEQEDGPLHWVPYVHFGV